MKEITMTLMFALTVLIGNTVYGLSAEEDKWIFIILLTVGISFCAILPLQFINKKKIKSEVNSRKENN